MLSIAGSRVFFQHSQLYSNTIIVCAEGTCFVVSQLNLHETAMSDLFYSLATKELTVTTRFVCGRIRDTTVDL